MRSMLIALCSLVILVAASRAEDPAVIEEKARQLIAQLSAADFDAREKAEAELKALGDSIVPLLRKLRDTNDDNETRRRLERIMAAYAAGAKVWQFEAGISGLVLIVGGERVFLQTGADKLSALEAVTGKKLWDFSADEAPPPGGGKRAAGGNILAAYANGKLFVTGVTGSLFAIDAATGKPLWTVATEIVDRSHPIVSGERIYFGSRAGTFFCVNALDGKIIWKQPRGPGSTAAVDGARLWLVDKDYKALSCLNTSDGAEAWSVKIPKSPFSSPALADGKVIVGDLDGVQAFNAADGKAHWQFATGFALEVGAPLVSNGRVYVGMNGQNFYCINANDGKEVWQFKAADASFVPPLAADDFVYVGCYGYRYHVLRAGKGTLHVEWNTESNVFAHALAGGRLYFLNLTGTLSCVRAGVQGGEDYPMFGGSATRGK